MREEFTIERLGHLGDGIAAGPVYARGTLPGEVVSGVRIGDRLSDIRVVKPSGARVRAPCAHSRSCGGCVLQHASGEFVQDWKAGIIRAALSAQRIEADIDTVITSSERSRRRAVLHGQRTKKGSIVGLFAPESDRLVEIPDCRVMAPGIMAAIPAIKELVAAGGSRKSVLHIAVTLSLAGPDIAVSGGKPLDRALQEQLAVVAGRHGFARLTWGGEVVAMLSPPVQPMGRALVLPPPGAFLQATAEGEDALVAGVARLTDGCDRIADLFAGCGTFSLPLSSRSRVHAVEGMKELLEAAEQGWRRAGGLHKLTTEARDLFNRPLMPEELNVFDAVVIDPPRAGASAQATELGRSKVRRVVSVSCNPVTFARDARILVDAGFELGPISVVDQFRWSNHIELFTCFTR